MLEEGLSDVNGTIYLDDENDDSYEGDEGLEGMMVSLRDVDGNALKTTVTDSNGFYEFTNLPEGEYCIHYENMSRYAPDSSIPGYIDPSTGE